MAQQIPYTGHMLHLVADVRNDGSMVFAWEEVDPYRIMFIKYTAKTKSWSKPMALATGNGGPQPEEPSIAVRGNLILVTFEQTHQNPLTNGPFGFYALSKDFGETWS